MNKFEDGQNNNKIEDLNLEPLEDIEGIEPLGPIEGLEDLQPIEGLDDVGVNLEEIGSINLQPISTEGTIEDINIDDLFILDDEFEISQIELPTAGISSSTENIIPFNELVAILKEGSLNFNIEDVKKLDRSTVVSAFDKNKLLTNADIQEQNILRDLLQDSTQIFTLVIDKFSSIVTHDSVDSIRKEILDFPINVWTNRAAELNINISSNFNILGNSQNSELKTKVLNIVRSRVNEVITESIKESGLTNISDLYQPSSDIVKSDIVLFFERVYNFYNEDFSLRTSIHPGNIFMGEAMQWSSKTLTMYQDSGITNKFPISLIPYLPSNIKGTALAATSTDESDLKLKVTPDINEVGEWVASLPESDFIKLIYGNACPESLKVKFAMKLKDLVPYSKLNDVGHIIEERLRSRLNLSDENRSNQEYIKALVNIRVDKLYNLLPEYSEEVRGMIHSLRQIKSEDEYPNNVCSISSYNPLTETCTCGNCGSTLPVDGSLLTYIRSGNSTSNNTDNIRVYTNLSICKNETCRFINTVPYRVIQEAKNLNLEDYSSKDKEKSTITTLNSNVILKLNCTYFGIPTIPEDGSSTESVEDLRSAEEEIALATLKSNQFSTYDDYIKSTLEFLDRADRLRFKSILKSGTIADNNLLLHDKDIKKVTIQSTKVKGLDTTETINKEFNYETLNLLSKSFCKINSKDYNTLKAMSVSTLMSELNISSSISTSINDISISYTASEIINNEFNDSKVDLDKIKDTYNDVITRIKSNILNLGMTRIRNIKLNEAYLDILNNSPLREDLLIVSELMIINELLPNTIKLLRKYGRTRTLGLEFYESSNILVNTKESLEKLYYTLINSDTVVGGYLHLLSECVPFLGYVRDYDLEAYKDSYKDFKSNLKELKDGLEKEFVGVADDEKSFLNTTSIYNDVCRLLDKSDEFYKNICRINYGYFSINSIRSFVSKEVYSQLQVLDNACRDSDITKDLFGFEMTDEQFRIINEFIRSTGYMSNKLLSFPKDTSADLFTLLDRYEKKQELVPTKEIVLISDYIKSIDIELISLSSIFNNLNMYGEDLYDCLFNYYKIYNYITKLDYGVTSLISIANSSFRDEYIFKPLSNVDVIRNYELDKFISEERDIDSTLSKLFSDIHLDGSLYDAVNVFDVNGEYKFTKKDLDKSLVENIGYDSGNISKFDNKYKIIEDIVGGIYEFNSTRK